MSKQSNMCGCPKCNSTHEASTSNNGSGGSEAPLPTWTKAVEEAVKQYGNFIHEMSALQPGGDYTPPERKTMDEAEALASIQAATADLLLELVGEDEPLRPHLPKQDPAAIRNLYRSVLREEIADLRAEGGK
jgi:hypothetical protein